MHTLAKSFKEKLKGLAQLPKQAGMPIRTYALDRLGAGGKAPKQLTPPQPGEKINSLSGIQSKNIVIDFPLAAVNGQVLPKGAARILLLLDSVGYHSYTLFGKLEGDGRNKNIC